MKKKGKKCLTLRVWRKPLNLWPRKMTQFFFLVRRDWERNRRERQRNSFKNNWSDSYKFEKYEIRLVERNWGRNRNSLKNRLNWLKGIRKESSKPESLSWKIEFSPSHFNQLKNRLDRSILEEIEILKILENFFCKNIWKIVFMIWDVCSWFQMFYKTKLF